MQSNNPIFSRSEGFNGRASTQYSDPSQWQIDLSGGQSSTGAGLGMPTTEGRMTIDTVVEKTAITLGLIIAAAAATWFVTGDVSQNAGLIWGLAMGGALVGLVLAFVVSFRQKINPAFVLAYAVVEGVFLGAFSKLIASLVSNSVGDALSLVFQAVLATLVVFAVTLGAYKYFNIQVTDKFRRGVTIALFSFLGIVLVNFVLSMFGVLESGGLRAFSPLGLVVSLIAVGLAVLCLILDFDYVEKGIAAGLPERESWRAAFGLAVTLVWMYIEILRILAILRGD